jgi:acetyl esterase/lipase
MSCESWDSNAPYDVVPFPAADNHMNPIALYLGEHTERYLTHPYASPLFGDFKGLPPLLVQAGDCEVLRDEIALLAHKATLAGVQVMHELYEDAVSRAGCLVIVIADPYSEDPRFPCISIPRILQASFRVNEEFRPLFATAVPEPFAAASRGHC